MEEDKIMKINTEFDVNEKVFDDLTGEEATVIGIEFKNGKRFGEYATACNTVGYWVNNDYLGGGRHPWELSKLMRSR